MVKNALAGSLENQTGTKVYLNWIRASAAPLSDISCLNIVNAIDGRKAIKDLLTAVVIHEQGAVFRLESATVPEIGHGEVLIAVAACAVNQLDIWSKDRTRAN